MLSQEGQLGIVDAAKAQHILVQVYGALVAAQHVQTKQEGHAVVFQDCYAG